jgi:hypothetical protein
MGGGEGYIAVNQKMGFVFRNLFNDSFMTPYDPSKNKFKLPVLRLLG